MKILFGEMKQFVFKMWNLKPFSRFIVHSTLDDMNSIERRGFIVVLIIIIVYQPPSFDYSLSSSSQPHSCLIWASACKKTFSPSLFIIFYLLKNKNKKARRWEFVDIIEKGDAEDDGYKVRGSKPLAEFGLVSWDRLQ